MAVASRTEGIKKSKCKHIQCTAKKGEQTLPQLPRYTGTGETKTIGFSLTTGWESAGKIIG